MRYRHTSSLTYSCAALSAQHAALPFRASLKRTARLLPVPARTTARPLPARLLTRPGSTRQHVAYRRARRLLPS